MLRQLRNLSVFILLMLTHICSISYAQYFSGPLAQSLGGAGRGAADEGEQILLNPAAIVHGSVFTSALIYGDGYTAKDEHDRILGLTIADNSEDVYFSGGLVYFDRRRTWPGFDSYDQHYMQVSIGKFIFKHFSVGLSVTYTKTELENKEKYDQWDGDLGFHYNPTPEFGAGIVFYNIGPRDLDAPKEIQNLESIAVGVHYIAMPMFRLRTDLVHQNLMNPDHKMEFQFGMESQFSEFLFTRLGYNHEPLTRRDYYSLGIGFDGPRMKLDYFYRKNADYNDGGMHGVDMRLPFW